MGPSVSLQEVKRLDHAQAENNQRAPESTPDTILKVITYPHGTHQGHDPGLIQSPEAMLYNGTDAYTNLDCEL